MKKDLILFFSLTAMLLLCSVSLSADEKPGHKNRIKGDNDKYCVVYKGDNGIAFGKKVVFIASDHEYRSEEILPALAKILAKRYGMTCTVVYALDEQGSILPGGSDLKGLEVLDDADLMVIFTRFANFNDKEMTHIDNFLKRGGPVIGLRTSTHAFKNKGNSNWEHYGFNYNGPKTSWKGGFGEYILGETWVGHYGKNHHQSSNFIIQPEEKKHPVLRGVKDVWVQSGGYMAEPAGTVLAYGQILNGMHTKAQPDKTKKEVPVAWIRDYRIENGLIGRAFATTHGASVDFLNEGYRRMFINASLWAMGMENKIKSSNNVDFVGPISFSNFDFEGYKANVKPSDLAGWESLIMPGRKVEKKKK